MYRKITAQRFGDPSVLAIEQIADAPQPGNCEVRVRVEAAGVGYTDTIVRRGRYVGYKGGVPVTPGYDIVGTVEALGKGVTGLRVGERVADMTVTGGYSGYIVRPATTLIPVPDGARPELAVEVPLMWVTAWQMLTRVVHLPHGAPVVVVGAAGNVGRALVSLGQHLGLKIVGTGSAGSVARLAAKGITAIDYRSPRLADHIRETSDGVVLAAFDAIGGDSWTASFAPLRNGGTLVGYGLQDFLDSGNGNAVALKTLLRFKWWNLRGRLDATGRHTAFYNIQSRMGSYPGDFRDDAATLLDLIAKGTVMPPEPEVLPLDHAARAHERIARGGLDTRLVLDPWR